MASKIDFSGLTLNSDEARETSQLVFEQTYARPEIANVHGIQTGVVMDRYIPILGQFDLVGLIDPGSCSVNTETGQISASEKQWTPKLISYRLAHCQADVSNLLKFWQRARIAAKTWEEVDNEMLAFLTDRITEATMQAILRLSSFGDTAADTVANGGVLTNGTTKGYFTPFNGLWKQVFTDQAGSAVSKRYEITANAGGTYVDQQNLGDADALNMFRYLYNNIDARAFEGQNLVFQITRSLFNNWQDFLEDKSLVFMLDRTEEGATKWSYRGIPIIVRHDWDRFIRTYFDNGTSWYLPHRAILTDINNIPIGTSDEESLTSLDAFYDRTDKTHYTDVAFKLDQKNLLEYGIAVAY